MNRIRNAKLTNISKALRRQMTKEEKHLWYDFLKLLPTTCHRQKIIDCFVVDFYCAEARLVIEIDGSQHYTESGIQQDEFRTEILEGYGLRVIRFTNHQIDHNFRGVCEYIDSVVTACMKS